MQCNSHRDTYAWQSVPLLGSHPSSCLGSSGWRIGCGEARRRLLGGDCRKEGQGLCVLPLEAHLWAVKSRWHHSPWHVHSWTCLSCEHTLQPQIRLSCLWWFSIVPPCYFHPSSLCPPYSCSLLDVLGRMLWLKEDLHQTQQALSVTQEGHRVCWPLPLSLNQQANGELIILADHKVMQGR